MHFVSLTLMRGYSSLPATFDLSFYQSPRFCDRTGQTPLPRMQEVMGYPLGPPEAIQTRPCVHAGCCAEPAAPARAIAVLDATHQLTCPAFRNTWKLCFLAERRHGLRVDAARLARGRRHPPRVERA